MPRDSRLQTLVDLGLVSEDVAAEIDRQQQAGAVRLGAALTLDDLYQLAQITQAEMARAAGEWQAETSGDASDWLTAAGGVALLALLLRDRGRGEVLDEIERNILRHQENMRNATQAMIDQRIGLADWQRSMATDMRGLHIQNGALGRGGLRNLTDADRAVLQDGLRFQFQHLDGFAGDIAAGNLSPAQMRARAELYAQSGRSVYWYSNTETQRADGMTEERRVAIGDSGTCTPCTDLAALGWQPIGSLPNPGGEPCDGLSNCRCEKEYQ